MKHTVLELQVIATGVVIDPAFVRVSLKDGREICFPWLANGKLRSATPEQRADVEIICAGTGLHWPQLDEDLSVLGIMEGRFGQKTENSVKRNSAA
jgi:hypothetical protein